MIKYNTYIAGARYRISKKFTNRNGSENATYAATTLRGTASEYTERKKDIIKGGVTMCIEPRIRSPISHERSGHTRYMIFSFQSGARIAKVRHNIANHRNDTSRG